MRSMTVGVNRKLDNFKGNKGRILKVTISVSLPWGRWRAKRDGGGELKVG